jgi:hypothetical protein
METENEINDKSNDMWPILSKTIDPINGTLNKQKTYHRRVKCDKCA